MKNIKKLLSLSKARLILTLVVVFALLGIASVFTLSNDSLKVEAYEIEDEPINILAHKVVCQTEEDLPNWGSGGGPAQIAETTAQDYITASNEACWFVSGWDFQWGFDGQVSSPSGNYIGPGGTGWNDFTSSTESNGTPAQAQISSLSAGVDKIWVKENLKDGYVPFAGPPSLQNDVSAELYCHGDVFNYDNYDYISNPLADGTYYCVGFNALLEPECTEQSSDWNQLDYVDIGNEVSEFYHPILGWSEENMPGNYGGCQQGAVCSYRQVIEGSCTGDEREATILLHGGSNTLNKLIIRHLDGISLLDGFDVYVNDILVGGFVDETQIQTEVWKETEFDIFSFDFTGDITVKLVAIDDIWSQCSTYGQVAIDWISLSGCGDQWEQPEPVCGNEEVEPGEECDDGNTEDEDGCSSECTIEQTCEYDCFVPDPLNDTQPETIVEDSETSLQDLLTGLGYIVDVNNDQTNIQVWHTNDTVELEITYLGGIAGDKHVFGYYLNGDPSTFVGLFERNDHPLYDLPIASTGDKFIVVMGSGDTVGFAIDDYNGGSQKFYSENSLNSESEDRVIVFDFCDEFVLGFNDYYADLDYQDIIVSVKKTDCGGSNPVCGDGTTDSGEECDDGNTEDGDGCSANCIVEDECESYIEVDITYVANYDPFEATMLTDMTDDVYVGNNLSPFGQTTVVIPLTTNNRQNAIIDPSSSSTQDNVPGLHVQRGEDQDGFFVEISAYGFNHSQSRESIEANIELVNAAISQVSNGPGGGYEKPTINDCGINEQDTASDQPGNDEYGLTVGESTGTICNVTNTHRDRVRIYYEPTEDCTPFCGNGVLEEGEECEENEDCCSRETCEECVCEGYLDPVCGDGTTDSGEECDDGNIEDGDGCSANCTIETYPQCTDNDDDGYFQEGGDCGLIDCNDDDATVNPGAEESCSDDIDNDCNGFTDCEDESCSEDLVCETLLCTDIDQDGYSIEGGDCGLIDCNDDNYDVNPAVPEICDNGIDDDCDGDIDEADTECESSPPGGGGGGGGGGPIGLYIFNEVVRSVTATSFTVTWFTNTLATTRVIYDTVSHAGIGAPPNYGYTWSTGETNSTQKVTFHKVTISGLTPGTSYYWRAISHGSPETWGNELSINTEVSGPPTGEQEEEEEEEEEEEIIPPTGEQEEEEEEEEIIPPTGEQEEEEEIILPIGEEEEEEEIAEDEGTQAGLAVFLADIGDLFSINDFCGILNLILLILIVLALVRITNRIKIEPKEKRNRWWAGIGLIIVIILISLFYLSICRFAIPLALILITLVLVMLKSKKI